MNELLLARLQFGITTVYHFFFVPLTLGLSFLVALLQTQYLRTGDESWKRLTKFWGKLFLINFAMGVVTGLVQEFQFGMNWSEYSRFVGDIFGAPLAIEALLAFFLESTFLGLWIFGWEKLPKKVHLASIWLVAIGTHVSAFWILLASSFMHQPDGFVLRNGRAEMNDFFALMSNSHLWLQFPHVIFSGLATGAFFMLGISAWHLMRGKEEEKPLFQRSFNLSAIAALVATILVTTVGHAQAQHMVRMQPMKMAAAEALWERQDPAGLALFAIVDEKEQRDVFSIRVPGLLSFLAHNSFSGEVRGIKDLQEEFAAKFGPDDYVPPVTLSFWCFRIMVGAGGAMMFAAIAALWAGFRRTELLKRPLFLTALFGTLFLPYIANSTGWIFTEVGRQPWVVYGILKTRDGLTPSANLAMVLFSLIGFTLLYGALMGVDAWLMARHAKKGTGAGDIEEAHI